MPSKISAGSGDMEVSTNVTVTENTSECAQNLTDENGNQNLSKEEVPAAMNDVSLNVSPFASESMDTSHVSAYSTLYWTDATEAKNVVLDVGENGVTSIANEFMFDAPGIPIYIYSSFTIVNFYLPHNVVLLQCKTWVSHLSYIFFRFAWVGY